MEGAVSHGAVTAPVRMEVESNDSNISRVDAKATDTEKQTEEATKALERAVKTNSRLVQLVDILRSRIESQQELWRQAENRLSQHILTLERARILAAKCGDWKRTLATLLAPSVVAFLVIRILTWIRRIRRLSV